jgi:hypothetical protein
VRSTQGVLQHKLKTLLSHPQCSLITDHLLLITFDDIGTLYRLRRHKHPNSGYIRAHSQNPLIDIHRSLPSALIGRHRRTYHHYTRDYSLSLPQDRPHLCSRSSTPLIESLFGLDANNLAQLPFVTQPPPAPPQILTWTTRTPTPVGYIETTYITISVVISSVHTYSQATTNDFQTGTN